MQRAELDLDFATVRAPVSGIAGIGCVGIGGLVGPASMAVRAKASGAGALSRQVMGFTVIGGMLAASFVAIFLIPALFHVVEKLSGKMHAAPVGPPPPGKAPEPAPEPADAPEARRAGLTHGLCARNSLPAC